MGNIEDKSFEKNEGEKSPLNRGDISYNLGSFFLGSAMEYGGLLLSGASLWVAAKYHPVFGIFALPGFALYTGGKVVQIPRGLIWKPDKRGGEDES